MTLCRPFALLTICTLANFASGFGQQNVHLFPAIPNETILDVVFVDSLHGFFSTAAGSIYRTEYGGWIWQASANYQGDPITRLRFLNPNIGFGASPDSGPRDTVGSVVTYRGGLGWYSESLYLQYAIDFLPVSESVLLKSEFDGIWRLDNFYDLWEHTFAIPRTVLERYGSVRQLLQIKGDTVLALAVYDVAKTLGVLSDSINLLFRSKNSGATWDTVWQGLPQAMNTIAFGTMAVGWMGGADRSIFKTIDGGSHWTEQYKDSGSSQTIQSIFCIDALRAFAVDGTGLCLKTTDGGSTWAKVEIEQASGLKTKIVFATPAKGFYAGSRLYRTDDGGNTWHFAHESTIIDSAWQIDFVDLQTGWVLADSGLYLSSISNGAGLWMRQYRFETEGTPVGFDMIDPLNGWAVNRSRRMKTTDGGYTWTSTDFDAALSSVGGIKFYNRDLGAIFDVREQSAPDQSSFLITTDGGSTWLKRPITLANALPPCRKVEFTDPGHLWFANKMGLWLSRDSARSWTLFDSLHPDNSAFDFVDSLTGYCDNGPDSFGRTTDGGRSWKLIQKPYSNQTFDVGMMKLPFGGGEISLLAGSGGTLFIVSSGDFIQTADTYVTSDLKNISIVRERNMPAWWVVGSRFDILNAVYRTTGVASHRSETPRAYLLEQNYPNPFNPSTTMRYALPHRSHVTLSVFNMLGQQVATLVNGDIEAGYHEAKFDATGLASGVYIYRFTAGSYASARKMLLIK